MCKMKPLKDIEIEPFTAMNYVSDEAERIWSPIIRDCSELIQELELRSVAADQRLCAWRTVGVNQISDFTTKCMKLGLSVYPIKNVGSWGGGFSHKTPPAVEGKPISSYCIITKSLKNANGFRKAHNAGDHPKQGYYLGFPECCTSFFVKYWPEYCDPIWQASVNHDKIERTNGDSFETNHDPLSIPILRYIGLRVGFHIPCSFHCDETVKLAEQRLSLCKSKRDKNIMKLLKSLLSMPMEWSVQHGIALVKTPIFYLRTNSIVTKEKYTIRLSGNFIPKESAHGAEFPFNLRK